MQTLREYIKSQGYSGGVFDFFWLQKNKEELFQLKEFYYTRSIKILASETYKVWTNYGAKEKEVKKFIATDSIYFPERVSIHKIVLLDNSIDYYMNEHAIKNIKYELSPLDISFLKFYDEEYYKQALSD